MNAEELKLALEGVPLRSVQVSVEGARGRHVATVSSPDFETMDHGERQSLVWQRLHEVFGLEQLESVEFVFTHTPSELAQMGAAASGIT